MLGRLSLIKCLTHNDVLCTTVLVMSSSDPNPWANDEEAGGIMCMSLSITDSGWSLVGGAGVP